MKLHLYIIIGIANYLQEHKPFYFPEMKKKKLITVNFVCSNNMMLIEGTRWSSL